MDVSDKFVPLPKIIKKNIFIRMKCLDEILRQLRENGQVSLRNEFIMAGLSDENKIECESAYEQTTA